ncbi:MAG: hypothetical protein ABIQ35_13355 [Verrucomicrobiota bacterium]
MIPWKVIFATLVIFCSGLVVGNLVAKKNLRAPSNPHPFHGALTNPPPSLWHQQQKDFLRRIDGELTLSSEQHAKIEKILKDSQERTKAIREKFAPEMKEELKNVREQIKAELLPAQQAKFDEAIKAKPARRPDESIEDFRRRISKEGGRRARTNASPAKVGSPVNP